MKIKNIVFLIILLGGFFFIPVTSLAVTPQPVVPPDEEEALNLPVENRTVYFMTYPNGVEEATEDKTVADKAKERLIYEGTTNENGEIILNNYNSEGQLRIVEEVPTGYTTLQREMTVDLAKNTTSTFTNYKGFINPNTGRSLIVVLVLAILVCIVALSLVKKQKGNNSDGKVNKKISKKTKMTVFIFSIVSLGVLVLSRNVNAENKDFVIAIKDNHGNKMANVEVKVYAKPIVEQDYSIKFSAGDGYFFDGSKTMYFRLPSESCTFEEFYNSLTDDQKNYLNYNWIRSYYDGHLRSNMSLIADMSRNNIVLEDGVVATTTYNDNNLFYVVTIDGNGGYVDFYGKKLTELHVYNDTIEYLDEYNNSYSFQKDGSYTIGLDTNNNCTKYNDYGLVKNSKKLDLVEDDRVDKYYVCYNSKPDGIYVNGELFRGNDDNCYSTAYFGWENNSFQLRGWQSGNIPTNMLSFGFLNICVNGELCKNVTGSPLTSFLYHNNVNVLAERREDLAALEREYEEVGFEGGDKDDDGNNEYRLLFSKVSVPDLIEKAPIIGDAITSLVVIKNGEEIVSFNSNDIECTGDGNIDSEPKSSCIFTNDEKIAVLNDYLSSVRSKCMIEKGEIKN